MRIAKLYKYKSYKHKSLYPDTITSLCHLMLPLTGHLIRTRNGMMWCEMEYLVLGLTGGVRSAEKEQVVQWKGS